jgi:hypothetical protein
LTLPLSPEPLKPRDDREHSDCCHHHITDPLAGLFPPVSLSDARGDVISLFPAKRRSKVFDQLFTFRQRESRSEQVILLFSAAQPELQARIEAVPHPQELAILGQPLFDPLPFPQQRFVRNTHSNLSLRVGVRDQQPFFDE